MEVANSNTRVRQNVSKDIELWLTCVPWPYVLWWQQHLNGHMPAAPHTNNLLTVIILNEAQAI